MAQQNITIGAADAKAGDTYFAAFTKTEANFTDLYSQVGADTAVYVSAESDFPTQDATTITLETNTIYILAADITTAKAFICQSGSNFQGRNVNGYTLSYTGTGAMFTSDDADFTISGMLISCPNAQIFSSTSTATQTFQFSCISVRSLDCQKIGTFDSLQLVQFNNCAFFPTTDGIEIVTDINILNLIQVGLISTDTSIKLIDLGTSVADVVEMTNVFFNAPAGAYGISGTTSNGNIVANGLGMVTNCEFVSGLTPLENITVDDIRWDFKDNANLVDTFQDALISFRSNATATTISASNTPVIVNATWVEQEASHFTTTSGGRITFDAERDKKFPVDISAGLISSGGGSIDVTLYIALNGSVVTASGVPLAISGSDSQTLAIPWQLELTNGDYIEVFVENNTNTTNIVVEFATLRIN